MVCEEFVAGDFIVFFICGKFEVISRLTGLYNKKGPYSSNLV